MVSRVVVFAILALVAPLGVAAAATANVSAMDFAADATVSNGDTMKYLLVATNNGPDFAINPKLVDTVPISVDFSTVQLLDGAAPGGTVVLTTDLPTRTATCAIQGGGQLAVGETLQCRLTMQASGIGTSVNNLLATNDLQDPAATGNTASATTVIQDPPPPTFVPGTVALGDIVASGAVAVAAKNVDPQVFLNVKSVVPACGPHATCTIAADTCTGARVTALTTCGFMVDATCTSPGAISGAVTFTDFSTGNPESLPITGNCVSPSTTTLASSAPSAPGGTSVTFTATVTATATGTVTFFDATTSLGTGTVIDGTATFATSTLAVGTHTITATYGGDATFAGSTSAPLTQTITQPTTTTLASSANPSGIGAAVTFTATVAPAGTGTVTFLDGTATLGMGTLSAGAATFMTSSLAAGVHAIVAQYTGDASFGASMSAPFQQTVGTAADFSIAASPQSVTIQSGAKASTTLTLTPTGGFMGTLALDCSDLPDDASCLFVPASAHLDGSNTPVTVQLTLDTALATVQSISRKTGGGRGALLLFGAVGFFGGKRRRAAKLVLLFGILACGGDSTPHSTPPGTYSVTVTASGSMTHAATLGLVVE